jgi:hypothetical protein
MSVSSYVIIIICSGSTIVILNNSAISINTIRSNFGTTMRMAISLPLPQVYIVTFIFLLNLAISDTHQRPPSSTPTNLGQEPFSLDKQKYWKHLSPSRSAAWTRLGWTEEVWDSFFERRSLDPPESADLDWKDLTQDQRAAASVLGYNQASWDADEEKSLSWTSALAAVALGLLVCSGDIYDFLDGSSSGPKDDQVFCEKLWRETLPKRSNWKTVNNSLGFSFHSAPGSVWQGKELPYWTEGAAYVLTRDGLCALQEATWTLHNMCLEAVDKVVDSEALMDRFEIPAALRVAVVESWRARRPDLIGRFDLLYSGQGDSPKLLEYNADTPTVLLESGPAQRARFELPERDESGYRQMAGCVASLKPLSDLPGKTVYQFNRVEELLAKSWPKVLRGGREVVLTAQATSEEEVATAQFLANMAKRAVGARMEGKMQI